MRSITRAIVLAAAALAACSHTGATQVDQLNRTIESLRIENAAYKRQVEELENRLFILSDQLESKKVNEQRVATPQLPTVTLHPGQVSVPPEPAPDTPDTAQPGSESDVEYAGEAAKPSVHRPVLRLHGEERPVLIERPEPEREPQVVAVAHEGAQTSNPRGNREASMEALQQYRKAYQALREGRHDDAVQGFKDFLRLFPSHDLTDNAQYWLGECYYDRKDYTTALREFRRVVERFPRGNKVPDALLKVGYSYLALGSDAAGKQTLEQLVRSYPRHEAAALASSRLGEMDRAQGSSSTQPVSSAAPPSGKIAHSPEEAP